jgi:DNA-binding response OmpR family regulator
MAETPAKPRILYVEDDINLGFVTTDNLSLQGFNVTHCTDGQEALKCFRAHVFDLCIVDVMLPSLDGFELSRRIRAINHQIPILFLTARNMKEDRLEGLRTGADDYLTKPFSLEELNLKIRIFLRRSALVMPNTEPQIFTLGNYELNFSNLKLLHIPSGKIQNLTLREGELVKLFFKSPNKLLAREEILIPLWGNNDYFNGRSLDVFISRLRKYLSQDERLKLENVHKVGFMLHTDA